MLKKQLTQRVYRPGPEDTHGAIVLDGTDVVLAPALINALRDLPDRDYLIARLANEAALADVGGESLSGSSTVAERIDGATHTAYRPVLRKR